MLLAVVDGLDDVPVFLVSFCYRILSLKKEEEEDILLEKVAPV